MCIARLTRISKSSEDETDIIVYADVAKSAQ